jgi:hypothetical protein
VTKRTPKISTILSRAARYIEENGWTQRMFFQHRNGREVVRMEGMTWGEHVAFVKEKGCKACALGAIYIGAGPELDDYQLEARFSEAATYAEGVIGYWPSGWNDNDERTKEEVVAGLKAAAKAARKDGK